MLKKAEKYAGLLKCLKQQTNICKLYSIGIYNSVNILMLYMYDALTFSELNKNTIKRYHHQIPSVSMLRDLV